LEIANWNTVLGAAAKWAHVYGFDIYWVAEGVEFFLCLFVEGWLLVARDLDASFSEIFISLIPSNSEAL
jgi:hypothetical protein